MLGLAYSAAAAQSLPGDEPLRGSFALPPPTPLPPQAIDGSTAPDMPGWRERRLPRRPPGDVAPSRVPLPALIAYPSAPSRRRPQVVPDGSIPALPDDAPTPAEAAIPVLPPPRRIPVEQDPFGPLGIRAGAFLLRPSIAEDFGYDSNPNRLSGSAVKGSAVLRTEGGLQAESNWSVHSLKVDLRGSSSIFPSLKNSAQPEGTGRAILHLDVNRATGIDLETHAAITTQSPNSPETGGSTGRTNVTTWGTGAGVTHNIGRIALSLGSIAEHTHYQDGTLAGGTVLPLSRDDFASYALKSRAGYRIGTAFNPFIETTLDMRRHDYATDANGYDRNSSGVNARLGNAFDIDGTLSGEVAAGFVHRNYEDARFTPLNGPSLDASLVWTVSPLTKVSVKAGTEIGETNLIGSSGVSIRKAEVEVVHALRRNLTLTGTARYTKSVYDGITLQQDEWASGFKAEYNLTRSLVIRGSYAYNLLRSSSPSSNYQASTFLLGLKLQR